MYRVFAGSSVILLVVFFITVVDDYARDWKGVQKKFYHMELDKAEDDRQKEFAKSRKVEIKQIMVDGPGDVDRCMTCHLGVEDSRFAETEEPYKTHPNPDQHPFAKFGCAVCHGGDPRAITAKGAHGTPELWENPTAHEPMLPKHFIQASCGKCHVADELPGVPLLALGRKLFDEKGCFNCHLVNGVGRKSIGPDLSQAGRYGRAGYRSPKWIFEHFKDPASLSPDTEMPNFRLSDEEANALTLLILSFTGEEISGYLGSKLVEEERQVAVRDYKESLKGPQPSSSGAKLYADIKCSACHEIKGKGGTIGPSLTEVGDRRKRQHLFYHFKSPRDVVSYTIMPNFRLSDEEAEDLTEYMLTLKAAGDKVIALTTMQEENLENIKDPGERMYRERKCELCHTLGGLGAPLGPDLSNIGKRRDAEWLVRHLNEGPKKAFSRSAMPRVKFSQKDAETLVKFLVTLKN